MEEYAEWEIEDEISEYQEKQPNKKKLGAKEGYNSNGRYDGKFRGHVGVFSWLKNRNLYGAGKNTAHETIEQRIVRKYASEVLNMSANNKPSDIGKEISKNHWESFKKWVKENYS